MGKKIIFHLLVQLLMIKLSLMRQVQSDSSNLAGYDDCLIHNKAYLNEYLYSPTLKLNENNRTMNVSINDVYLLPLDKVNDFGQLRWSLIEITNQTGYFYLKNSHNDQYLCIAFNMAAFINSRGKIRKLKLVTSNDYFYNCIWNVKKVGPSSAYTITSMLFDESLNAISYFFRKRIDYKREVVLMNNKYSYSNKAVWIIDCKRGSYLWI